MLHSSYSSGPSPSCVRLGRSRWEQIISELREPNASRLPLNKTALAMIFKLAEAAEKSRGRLDGHNQLPKIILGVRFADGMEVVRSQHQVAAA